MGAGIFDPETHFGISGRLKSADRREKMGDREYEKKSSHDGYSCADCDLMKIHNCRAAIADAVEQEPSPRKRVTMNNVFNWLYWFLWSSLAFIGGYLVGYLLARF